MKEFKTKMSESMRNAIYSVIESGDKEACLKILREALEEFISAYHCDKVHARMSFNACLVNALMQILMED